MHNNQITQLLDLLDLITSEVIHQEDRIIFIPSSKKDDLICYFRKWTQEQRDKIGDILNGHVEPV